MNYQLIKHPLITHKLSIIRDASTNSKDFKEIVSELSSLMVYEIARDLPLKPVTIQTPIQSMNTFELAEKVLIVPILRAGLGMVDGIFHLIPNSKIAHVGMYRDPETLIPKVYYSKFPDHIEDYQVYIVDPLLATGGSIIAALDKIKELGIQKVKVVSLIAVKEGLTKIYEQYPNVKIYIAALDEGLNSHAYIYPGLGDAGDRIFGTK